MKFLQNMKKKKANNKGFSLVELIIVIAIMAILVGVVGSQVVPYLEKSRKSKDIQILSAWVTDSMSAFSASAASLDSQATYTITIKPDAAAVVTSSVKSDTAGAAALQKELVNFNADFGKAYVFDTEMESKAGRDISQVVITCCDSSLTGAKNDITLVVTNKTTAKYSFDPITSN